MKNHYVESVVEWVMRWLILLEGHLGEIIGNYYVKNVLKTKINKKRKQKSPKQKAKDRAWKYCSIYNRMKDADWRGNVKCCTCDTVKHWKELQAGHFEQGRGGSILFEDRNIHAQCYGCNCGKHSNPRKYDAYMRKRYGDKVVEELDALADTSVQYTLDDYLRIAKEYILKIDELKNNN